MKSLILTIPENIHNPTKGHQNFKGGGGVSELCDMFIFYAMQPRPEKWKAKYKCTANLEYN